MMKIDAIKAPLATGGGGKVGVGLDDDMADGMQCSDHPYRSNPGGICAFCLQEKLGKLVSSSLPLPIRGSSSSPSSPSTGSESIGNAVVNVGAAAAAALSSNAISIGGGGGGGSTSRTVNFNVNGVDCHYHDTKRARIPFLLAKKKKKVVTVGAEYNRANDVVFKRSKSTTAPRRGQFIVDGDDGGDFSPRKRGGFWSFLYHHAPSLSKSHAPRKMESNSNNNKGSDCNLGANGTILEEDESPNSNTTSFERKVSRSRSVGCGSRSFSGDFFERISTGFGDCTLRRVESQRESKSSSSSSKVAAGGNSGHRNAAGVDHHCIKERVKCGGLFSGFMLTSSSSSSSSSSYLVSSSADELSRKPTPATATGPLISGGRSRTWTWAFASPMRAFKPSNSKDRKRSIIRQASENNPTPDLNAIPSLLAVRS